MISEPGIAVILAFLISVVHFLGEELEEYISGYREEIVSFSSGASITYIFGQLMPEFHRIAVESTDLIFLLPLFGFSSIHLLEKFVARSGLEQEKIRKDYVEIHSVFLFLYNGAIGYLIASLITESAVSGLLFFLPIILHVGVSSFSTTELHESFSRKTSVKFIISIAPLIGALAHNLGSFADQHFHLLFGTVIGMFFYVVIRDSIPGDEQGRPTEYLAGTLIYLAVILVANTI